MLIQLYLLFICVSLGFFVLSFFKDDLIFKWIATILFFSLAITGFSIQYPYCEYDSSATAWSCHVESHNDTGVIYLFFGLGILSLAYSIIYSIYKPAEQVAEAERRL